LRIDALTTHTLSVEIRPLTSRFSVKKLQMQHNALGGWLIGRLSMIRLVEPLPAEPEKPSLALTP
jgi:hypothetical protein